MFEKTVCYAIVVLKEIKKKMSFLSISALAEYFDSEEKSLKRGENHYDSGHVESFSYSDGVINGLVHASMKDRKYKVTVSSILFYIIIFITAGVHIV